MAVWRIRTEVRDRPGELAAVARALAERDGNILGLSVQIGARGVVDEFLVAAPGPIAPLVEDVGRAGGRRCEAIPSRPGELIDEATRALLLAARVRSDPAELPAALRELLRADDATWTRPSDDDPLPDSPHRGVLALSPTETRATDVDTAGGEAGEVEGGDTASARAVEGQVEGGSIAGARAGEVQVEGGSIAGAKASEVQVEGGEAAGVGLAEDRVASGEDAGIGLGEDGVAGGKAARAGLGEDGVAGGEDAGVGLGEIGVAGGAAHGMTGGTLVVAVGPLRAVRVRRAGWPFTLTEAARADALARSALPLPGPRPDLREVPLSNGATVRLRPISADDVPALHELHARCSPDTRRMRYFSAMPRLAPRVVEVLCDADRGLTLVAEVGGRLVGMANLMYAPEPGVGEMAFLIEDSWQNLGLGTATACRLMEIARDWGMAEVRASTLYGNRRMARLLTGLGATLTRGDDHILEARLPVTTTSPA